MLNPAVKRFILPFSPQKNSEPLAGVEEAAVYALAEFERSKGGGLILKQPEEKLVFLAKMGYPLWLYPKNEVTYLFDGLRNHDFSTSYFDLPSPKAFLDSFEGNSNTREEFMTFLSENDHYFSQSREERQFSVSDLIVEADFKKEISVYRREAQEITSQIANYQLLPPSLEETSVSARLMEIAALQAAVREDADKLPECLRLLNKTTDQYVTELDYAAEAVKDEANAKIKAQQEFINPKVAALSTEYKRRIADLNRSFDLELEKQQKIKAKADKSIEAAEGKIRQYKREAETQASKNHLTYEKQWKKKTALTKRELSSLKKELERAEKNSKNIDKQKTTQTTRLRLELEKEVKRLRQPLTDLQVVRDARMLVFKRETEKLLKLEKPVVDGLNIAIKLAETVNAKFAMLGTMDMQLKGPSLFYVPFYAVCYQTGVDRRVIFLPPSMASTEGLAAKIKGAFGRSKIKQLLIPRFEAISRLINDVQVLAKRDAFLDSQIRDLGEKSNMLDNHSTRGKIAEGLLRLRSDGWLSDKEYQTASHNLA